MRDFRVLFTICIVFLGCQPEVQLPPKLDALADLLMKGQNSGEPESVVIVNPPQETEVDQPVDQKEPQWPAYETPEEVPMEVPTEVKTQPEPTKDIPTPESSAGEFYPEAGPCEGEPDWRDEVKNFQFHAHGFETRAQATFGLDPATGEKLECQPSEVVITYENGGQIRGDVTFTPSSKGFDSFIGRSYKFDGQIDLLFLVEAGKLNFISQWSNDYTHSYESFDNAADGIYIPGLPINNLFESVLFALVLQNDLLGDADAYTDDSDYTACKHVHYMKADEKPAVWPLKSIAKSFPDCEEYVHFRAGDELFYGLMSAENHFSYYEMTQFDAEEREILFYAMNWMGNQQDFLETAYRETHFATDGTSSYSVYDRSTTKTYQRNAWGNGTLDEHLSISGQTGGSHYVRQRTFAADRLIYQNEYAPRSECTNAIDCNYDLAGAGSEVLVRIIMENTGPTSNKYIRVYDGALAIGISKPTEVYKVVYLNPGNAYSNPEKTKVDFEEWRFTKPAGGVLGPLFQIDSTGEDVQGFTKKFSYDEGILMGFTEKTLSGVFTERTAFEYTYIGFP